MSQAGQIVYLTPVESLTGNTGGYVEPALGNINILGTGDVTVANSIPGDPASNTLLISVSEYIANTYTTNSGNAIPSGNILNVLGGSNITTVGSGNTITIDLYDSITLPATSADASKGVLNIGIGNPVLQAIGTDNIFLGGAGNFTMTTAVANVATGKSAASALTVGDNNCIYGVEAAEGITSGSNNIILGKASASAYISSESSNIILGNAGVLAESNKIRIGTYGTGAGQQDTAYIAGIVHASNGLEADAGDIVAAVGNITATAGYINTVNNSVIIGSTASSIVANDLDFKKIHGTGIVEAGDELGNIAFKGYDGSVYELASYIQANVVGTPAAGRVGSTLNFGTHPDAATVAVERVAIASTGAVTINAPDSGVGLTIQGGGVTVTDGNITQGNGDLFITNTDVAVTGPYIQLTKTRSGGVITSGDGLGGLFFFGNDGTSAVNCSSIIGVSSGTIATGRIGSNLEFFTHPDSVTISQKRMDIASTGAVTISTPDSGVALTITAGGETITAGNLVVTAGDITATAGAISAGTTVTAGTNLISTAGNLQLPTTSSTAGQIEINSVPVLHAYGTHNIFLGSASGNVTLNTAHATDNVAVGYGTLAAVSGATSAEGLYNVAVGSEALSAAVNPAYCIAVGYNAGSAWTTTETSNIAIGSVGVAAESHVIHLGGGTGSSAGQQNKCFISGIYGITVGATAGVNITDSTDQIGTLSGSAGQVLQGGTKPSFSTATYPSTVTKGDVLVASANNVVDVVSGATTSGYVLTANGAGTAPSFQAASSGGMTWNSVSGTTQSMTINNGYVPSNTAMTTITLPSTAAFGSTVAIAGYGAGGWKLAQNSGQIINFGTYPTTTGTSGALYSSASIDSVTLLCIVANTTWTVISAVGNIIVV